MIDDARTPWAATNDPTSVDRPHGPDAAVIAAEEDRASRLLLWHSHHHHHEKAKLARFDSFVGKEPDLADLVALHLALDLRHLAAEHGQRSMALPPDVDLRPGELAAGGGSGSSLAPHRDRRHATRRLVVEERAGRRRRSGRRISDDESQAA